jgi:hypothetical protein
MNEWEKGLEGKRPGREEKGREGDVRVRVRVPVEEECDISCANIRIERGVGVGVHDLITPSV